MLVLLLLYPDRQVVWFCYIQMGKHIGFVRARGKLARKASILVLLQPEGQVAWFCCNQKGKYAGFVRARRTNILVLL
jgi:hypothetical protein